MPHWTKKKSLFSSNVCQLPKKSSGLMLKCSLSLVFCGTRDSATKPRGGFQLGRKHRILRCLDVDDIQDFLCKG